MFFLQLRPQRERLIFGFLPGSLQAWSDADVLKAFLLETPSYFSFKKNLFNGTKREGFLLNKFVQFVISFSPKGIPVVIHIRIHYIDSHKSCSE